MYTENVFLTILTHTQNAAKIGNIDTKLLIINAKYKLYKEKKKNRNKLCGVWKSFFISILLQLVSMIIIWKTGVENWMRSYWKIRRTFLVLLIIFGKE